MLKGFLREEGALAQLVEALDGIGRVAGGQQDPDPGPGLPEPAGQLHAAHGRHRHVGDEQLDLPLTIGGQVQGLPGVAGREQLPAGALQDVVHQAAHHGVVLAHQERLATRPGQGRGRPRLDLLGLLDPRQQDDEGRAPARLAGDLDAPADLVHDPLDRGEPQPGALADRLGREERVEDLRAGRGVHPGPLVGDPEDRPGLRG